MSPTVLRPTRWPWPLPALLAWGLCWATWVALRQAGAGGLPALLLASAAGAVLALGCRGRARRFWVAAGFPLSAFALGAAPAWAWLLLLAPLLLAYPLRAWRDAPLFPTPAGALQGLDQLVGQPRVVLDAGCGLGHGLQALRGLWPTAELHGVEWSPLLAAWTRLRCPWARVTRQDLWAQGWHGFDLVYAFQRPESMSRLWAKACADLAPGAWLVSLEFEVPGLAPTARLQRPGQRPVWIYRTPGEAGGSTAAQACR